ncbi:MAG: hypothetical protein KME20_16150 [Kaiparowitsia implicata GSE-PSE-MK54-09C]|jgi:hypothetical protein|nr:hypothetical protein [Kaiparowitsia implicata GSE-PSE-MK54-09C]
MKYSLTRSKSDWRLHIWEPAPINHNRVSPFLYKINLRFGTEYEAREALSHFLQMQQQEYGEQCELISA